MSATVLPSSSTTLLLTPREAAQTLAISERKLWSLTASGDVPHVRLGRCVRYPAAALAKWIAERTTRQR